MKKKDLDTNSIIFLNNRFKIIIVFFYKALNVWQPEYVNLVGDLLELEQAPIRETLVVEGLKPDARNENFNLVEYHSYFPDKKQINTQVTPMGRPINMKNYSRWNKSEEIYENRDEENTEEKLLKKIDLF